MPNPYQPPQEASTQRPAVLTAKHICLACLGTWLVCVAATVLIYGNISSVSDALLHLAAWASRGIVVATFVGVLAGAQWLAKIRASRK